MPLRVDDELVNRVLNGALDRLPGGDLLNDLVRSGFLVRRGGSTVELAPGLGNS